METLWSLAVFCGADREAHHTGAVANYFSFNVCNAVKTDGQEVSFGMKIEYMAILQAQTFRKN